MITSAKIRELVLKKFKSQSNLQFEDIKRGVKLFVSSNNLGNSDEINNSNVSEIVWDLIIERIITLGSHSSNPIWPNLRLTDFGRSVIESCEPHFYDPEEYLTTLKSLVPNLDDIIAQYAIEALKCYRHNLLFASAVIIGAAAERALILLLEAICDWEQDKVKKQKAEALLSNPKLPKMFETIRSTIEQVDKKKLMPYKVHEGAIDHIISFCEMIRVHRNDAVHPEIGQVSREKILLSINTFPVGLQVLERVRNWFNSNK